MDTSQPALKPFDPPPPPGTPTIAHKLTPSPDTPSSAQSPTPSSPLSELSKSPSLPSSPVALLASSSSSPAGKLNYRYPSPSSTSQSSAHAMVSRSRSRSRSRSPERAQGPDKTINVSTASVPDTQEPPRKRRRITTPKERTTEFLDLDRVRRDQSFDDNSQYQLDRLVSILRRQKKIVVIAGAGISVSAGIPDFRSKQGLFATLPSDHKIKGSGKHLFDASVYKHDSTTEKFHKMVCDLGGMVKAAEPTAFHHMIASLAEEGRLTRLYTQNVDCIDTNLPPLETKVPLNTKGPWPKTIQLHGSVEKMVCSKCTTISPFVPELFSSHEAPLCEECKEMDVVRTMYGGKRSHGIGRLRPRMVLYNEYNPDEEAIGNVSSSDLKGRPDAVVVVGTSLKIPGVRRLVKELCQATRSKRGGFTAWINVDPEPQHNDFKDCWDMVVRGKADDIAHFTQLPQWDEPAADRTTILSKEDDELREQWLRRDKVEVRLSQSAAQKPDELASPTSKSKSKIEVVLKSSVEKVQGIPTPSASPKIPPTLPDNKASKTKQSKLSFGRTPLPDSSTAESTAKKRKKVPSSKPAKRAKATAPQKKKNTVTQTFRAVKKNTAPPAMEEKPSRHIKKESTPPDSSGNELPPLRPSQSKPRVSSMHKTEDQSSGASRDSTPIALPSSDTIHGTTAASTPTPHHEPFDLSRSSPCIGVSTENCKGSIIAAGGQRPVTPTDGGKELNATVSPISRPRGMENLFD